LKDNLRLVTDIDKENDTTQTLIKRLKADYNLVPEGIPARVAHLQGKITDLQGEKQSQIRYTNECEQV
jgi:hypothetical protein